jgi:putative inorganic carbon (HCO3(-)) transporter
VRVVERSEQAVPVPHPESARAWWRDVAAASIAIACLALTFAAPLHRTDLVIIGVLGAAASLSWRPRVGPFLIAAALPSYWYSRSLVGPLAVSPPGLALILAWLAALVQAARGRLRLVWPSTGYEAPLALFLLAALLGLLVSEYPLLSVRELRALFLEPVLFLWLLTCLPGSPRIALSGFLAAITLAAVVAVLQVGFGLGGTEAEGVRRAQAWYPSPNHLALTLGRAWPFVLAGALSRRPLLALAAVPIGLAVLLTFSTGGWVGAAIASVVVVGVMGYRRLAVRLGGAMVLVLLLVSGLAAGGMLPERLNPLRQTGGFRLDLWLSSLAMLRDHPLFGVGPDNFVYQYQQIYLRQGASAEPNLSHPHNWLLNMWLELGVLGLGAFVWLVVRFLRRALTQPRSWVVAGAMGAMADMLAHGLVDNSYFLVDLAFLFWLILSLV